MVSLQLWPFLGRDDLLADASRALKNGGVLLTGPAGIGKTRALDELLTAQQDEGAVVRRFRASAGLAAVPMGAFSGLIGAAANLDNPTALMANASRALQPQEDRAVVVAVDDLQHLDSLSISFLLALADSAAVGLALTMRDVDTAETDISPLWTGDRVERLDMLPLDDSTVGEVAAAFLGSPLQSVAAERVVTLSGGNPLYLRELLVEGARQGWVHEQASGWDLDQGAFGSRRFRDLVDAHRLSLSSDARDLLDLLAVAEVPIEVELAEAIFPGSLEELERCGRILVDRSIRPAMVQGAHALIDEIIRSLTVETRARRLLVALTDSAEEVLGGKGDAIRTAVWQLKSGEPNAGRFLAGAQGALARFDGVLGGKLARAAVAAGGGVSAELMLGQAECVGQDPTTGADRLSRVFAAASTDGDQATAAEAAQLLARFRLMGELDAAGALGVFKEALAVVDLPAWRDALVAEKALVILFSGSALDAVPLISPLYERDDVDATTMHNVLTSLAVAYTFSGQRARAMQVRDRWHDLVEDHGGHAPVAVPRMAVAAAVAAQAMNGDLDGAMEEADVHIADLMGRGEAEHAAAFEVNRAAALVCSGFIVDGHAHVAEAVRTLRNWDPMRVVPFALALNAYTAAHLDHLEEAAALLDELAALPEPLRRPAEGFHLWARAWHSVRTDQVDEATEFLRDAARACRRVGHSYYEAMMLHDLVRLGKYENLSRPLRGLADVFDDDLIATIYPDHADGLASDDGVALAAVAARYAEKRSVLDAAEAYSQAARAFKRAGVEAQSVACVAAARSYLAIAGCPPTPAIGESPGGLTNREAQVARLAAIGMTNREIAEQLGVSKRTIDNQLSSVYSKMMISGRVELPMTLRTRSF